MIFVKLWINKYIFLKESFWKFGGNTLIHFKDCYLSHVCLSPGNKICPPVPLKLID